MSLESDKNYNTKMSRGLRLLKILQYVQACIQVVYKIPYRRARAWPRPSASREQRYLAYKYTRDPIVASARLAECALEQRYLAYNVQACI